MLYKLNNLSREELESLYLTERQRLFFAAEMKTPHNTLQAIKVNLSYIDREMRRKKILQKNQ